MNVHSAGVTILGPAGQVVGYLVYFPEREHLTMLKFVDPDRHFYRRLSAWGVSRDALEQAKGLGAEDVVLELPTGAQLRASIELIEDRGIVVQHADYEAQYMLPQALWEHTEPEEAQP